MEKMKYPEIPIFEKIDGILSLVSLYPTGISATEILEQTQYPRTTVYRILFQLVRLGYLAINERNHLYTLGQKLTYLRLSDIERHSMLQHCAAATLSDLSYKIKKTVKLSVKVGFTSKVLCCAKNDEPLLSYLRVGTIYPLHAGAASKILMNTLSEQEFRIYFAMGVTAYTLKTITSQEAMKKELASIQELGYAVDTGEYQEEIGAIAFPVFDSFGNIIAAISVAFDYKNSFDEIFKLKSQIEQCACLVSSSFVDFLKGNNTI